MIREIVKIGLLFENNIKDFLATKNLLTPIRNGDIKCERYKNIITEDNIEALRFNKGKVMFTCNNCYLGNIN